MCGIVGIVGPQSAAEDKLAKIQNLLTCVEHRGPDSSAKFEIQGVAIGFNRLAFVDIENNHQPYVCHARRFVVCFNGEIYNHRDLRQLLHSKGFSSKTASEVEIIAELCHFFSIAELMTRINGMFAIFIHDFNTNTSYLCRDRFGKKPLYYCFKGDELYFGSELHLFKQIKDCEISTVGLATFLQFNAAVCPHSLIESVSKVPYGSIVAIRGRHTSTEYYWRPILTNQRTDISLDEAANILAERLSTAISRRLSDEVQIGFSLSGGLDSSLIAAIATRQTVCKTFSIGFEDKSFDELRYSQEVAQYLGTKHYPFLMTLEDLKKTSIEILSAIDEPVNDPSLVPTYFLFKHSREHVKGLLTGDGADELFMGYRSFQLFKLSNLISPLLSRNFLVQARDRFNSVYSERNLSPNAIASAFLKVGASDQIRGYYEVVGAFAGRELNDLLIHPVPSDDLFMPIRQLVDRSNRSDLETLQLSIITHFLRDQILNKLDRASMYNSMEARCPFLDNDVVDLAFTLPQKYKFCQMNTKQIVKKVAKNFLPKSIWNRTKQGFRTPIAALIQHKLRDETYDLLTGSFAHKQGIFNERYTSRLVDDHFRKKVDNHKKLWSLLSFQFWYLKHRGL